MSSSSSSSSRPKAKAPAKKEPGDKIFVGGSAQDRRVFIQDIVNLIQAKGAKTLLVTIVDLSEYLHKQPALSPSNLFRKQYGNLEHVFSYEHLDAIFLIENSVIRLQPLDKLKAALGHEYLPQALYDQCAEMHRVKRTHDLTTWKSIGKNECARCGASYSVLANNGTPCQDAHTHQPAYDFTKSDDVMACAI